MKPTESSSDETFALELLKAHLTNQGESGFHCDVNKNDPPDLVITWECGEQWGVEVTRTYQQVEKIGKPENVSSEEVSAPLFRFAEKLEEKFRGIRHRDYSLCLQGPGPFTPWKHPVSLKQWKNQTEELIRKHIESDASGVLRFCGGALRPGGKGERWIVMVGNPATELASATTAMLSRSLEDKAADLQNWKGKFAQRWLLLLNCYPHAENKTEVESTLRRLGSVPTGTHRFDGIFWSGFPDRTLIQVPLTTER